MRESSVRWGLGSGIAATATGVLAIFLGTIFEPTTRYPDAISVATALFVRGILILISLGLALSFTYYAGMRIEQAAAPAYGVGRTHDAQTAPGASASESKSRVEAGLAGGIALAAYWAITTLYLWVLLAPQSRMPIGPFFVSRLLFGVLCILLGAGMGAIGARGALARRALLTMTLQRSQASALALPTPPTLPTPASPTEHSDGGAQQPSVEAFVPSAPPADATSTLPPE